MKKCILLSSSNFSLMQELRIYSRQNKIEIIPCKYFFEVVKNLSFTKSIVLIDGSQFIDFMEYLKNFRSEVFLVEDKKIKSFSGEQVFDSYSEFFQSRIFDDINEEDFSFSTELLDTKLEVVGIHMNNWKSIFIKDLIIQMREKSCNHLTKQFLDTTAVNLGVHNKNINTALAPIFKEFSKNIDLKLEKYNTYKVIDEIYKYIFN